MSIDGERARHARLGPALLDDEDRLAESVERHVAATEEELGPSAPLEAALDAVREQLDEDARDALALAVALLEERRLEIVLSLVRAAIHDTIAANRDLDRLLEDDEHRAWWIDRVLRDDPEVRRLDALLRDREDALRASVTEGVFRMFGRVLETYAERGAATHDAIVLALLGVRAVAYREAGL